jgi:CRP/FNR family transcriptional regulator
VIPADLFRALMQSADRFSADVFRALARRIDVLVGLIEQISVLSIDQRLAALLLTRGREIRATHQELADELGCARENLSRALGRFRRSGLVQLSRSRVVVLDAAALTSIAAPKQADQR